MNPQTVNQAELRTTDTRPYVLREGKSHFVNGKPLQPGESVHLTEKQAEAFKDKLELASDAQRRAGGQNQDAAMQSLQSENSRLRADNEQLRQQLDASREGVKTANPLGPGGLLNPPPPGERPRSLPDIAEDAGGKTPRGEVAANTVDTRDPHAPKPAPQGVDQKKR